MQIISEDSVESGVEGCGHIVVTMGLLKIVQWHVTHLLQHNEGTGQQTGTNQITNLEMTFSIYKKPHGFRSWNFEGYRCNRNFS